MGSFVTWRFTELCRLLKRISFEIFPQKTELCGMALGHGAEKNGMWERFFSSSAFSTCTWTHENVIITERKLVAITIKNNSKTNSSHLISEFLVSFMMYIIKNQILIVIKRRLFEFRDTGLKSKRKKMMVSRVLALLKFAWICFNFGRVKSGEASS